MYGALMGSFVVFQDERLTNEITTTHEIAKKHLRQYVIIGTHVLVKEVRAM